MRNILTYLRLIRLDHWIKNAFIFAPLFLVPSLWHEAEMWRRVTLAFIAFSLVASAMYILNDWIDRAADRTHPLKSARPIASGNVGPRVAFVLALALTVAGFALATVLSPAIAGIFFIYLFNNLLYNAFLRKKALLDVASISFGFMLRIFVGAVAINVAPSSFIIICVMLLSLFLALEKRRDDLYRGVSGESRPALAGYNQSFLDVSTTVLLGALTTFYLVYVTDQRVMERLHSEYLYLTAPFVILGVLRYLQLAHIARSTGSPVGVLEKDRFIQLCVVLWLASFAALISS